MKKKKNGIPRLSLTFPNGVLNLYTCSVQIIEGDPDDDYDYEVDVMSHSWNAKKALATLKKMKDEMVCDVLMDQNIFAGVGNIIKNEVLFRIKAHPENLVGSLKTAQLKKLVEEARNYSFNFYEWKKIYQLRKHWLIYKKRKCTQCANPITAMHTGKGKRYSYFCEICQPKAV